MSAEELNETEIRTEGQDTYVSVKGKLDTMRAMSLDEQLNDLPEEVINIYFDFDGLDYIASAGLRILFWAQEYTSEKGGKMSVSHVSKEIDEIFEMTGFRDMINIEG